MSYKEQHISIPAPAPLVALVISPHVGIVLDSSTI